MWIKFSRLCYPKQNTLYNFFSNRLIKCNFCSNNLKRDRKLEYLLILDFEATCEKKTKIEQEIIEFPCLKINITNFKEEGRFHHYVRPILNPILSNFCVELTGILQEMVEGEKTFPEVLNLFEEWREAERLTDENSLYVTSGDWDLGSMLPKQCLISGLKIPSHAMEWIDVKKLCGNTTGRYCTSLIEVIKHVGLEFEGRQHSGIDDCINIYNVVKRLAMIGASFNPTSKLVITNTKRTVQTVGFS